MKGLAFIYTNLYHTQVLQPTQRRALVGYFHSEGLYLLPQFGHNSTTMFISPLVWPSNRFEYSEYSVNPLDRNDPINITPKIFY